jgi:hypothetical protein
MKGSIKTALSAPPRGEIFINSNSPVWDPVDEIPQGCDESFIFHLRAGDGAGFHGEVGKMLKVRRRKWKMGRCTKR